MISKIIFIILCCLTIGTVHSAITVANRQLSDELNDTPIIGILSQEISYHLNSKYPGEYTSFIAASYVKFVEGGGGRVIPIWIGKTKEYYEDILSKINGVLFPGGATWFNQTDGYAEAGRYIYDIASDMNDNGIYMPIWGTCLGFELLTYLSADNVEHRAHCASDRQALPLVFIDGYRNSELFKSAPQEITYILSRENVTPNFHQFCVTQKNLTDYNLDQYWDVLSLNDDWNGLTFISSIEHKKYPFYGVQFHPEKTIYEWIANRNITHTANAIKSAQYFAQFFVNEARQNHNGFKDVDDENDYLIYNFKKTFTALEKSAYEECYMFDETVQYGSQRNNSNSLVFGNLVMMMFLLKSGLYLFNSNFFI